MHTVSIVPTIVHGGTMDSRWKGTGRGKGKGGNKDTDRGSDSGRTRPVGVRVASEAGQ